MTMPMTAPGAPIEPDLSTATWTDSVPGGGEVVRTVRGHGYLVASA